MAYPGEWFDQQYCRWKSERSILPRREWNRRVRYGLTSGVGVRYAPDFLGTAINESRATSPAGGPFCLGRIISLSKKAPSKIKPPWKRKIAGSNCTGFFCGGVLLVPQKAPELLW